MSEAEPKPFLRPGKVILLVLMAALVYLFVLVAWVPAGWLWQQVSGRIALPQQVQVQQVSGRLWEGAAGVVVAGHPVRIGWQLAWPSLSQQSLPLDISVASSQSALTGEVLLRWPGAAEISARGAVAVSEFEELIRRSGGAMIQGEVTVDRLDLAWADNRLVKADGLARWPGGRVTWPMGSQTGQAVFPPMRATLDSTSGGIALSIAEQQGDGPAANASILWNGMMELRVFKRMIDLAGQPWSESAQPDDVVFRVRQPLLPGAR